MHSCSAVWRAGKLAARWDFRYDPFFHSKKVRAFTVRHACTQS